MLRILTINFVYTHIHYTFRDDYIILSLIKTDDVSRTRVYIIFIHTCDVLNCRVAYYCRPQYNNIMYYKRAVTRLDGEKSNPPSVRDVDSTGRHSYPVMHAYTYTKHIHTDVRVCIIRRYERKTPSRPVECNVWYTSDGIIHIYIYTQ